MQNGDRVQFVSCPELPAVTDSATFYYLQNSDKLYLGSQLIANNVKDVQNSETPGKLRITQFDGSTREIDIPGNAFGIDCYKGKFPLDFTSPGGVIDEWKIYGNSSGHTEVLETQSILPTTITAHSGNAVDWEIYGNNNPVVENKTGDLPIEVSATAGNAVDWTIYGNDDNGTEQLINRFRLGSLGSLTYNDRACSNVMLIDSDKISIEVFANDLRFAVYELTQSQYEQYLNQDKAVSSYDSGWKTSAYTVTPHENIVAIVIMVAYLTLAPITTDYILSNITAVKGSTAPDHYIPYQQGVGERTENVIPSAVNGTYTSGRGTVTCNNGNYHFHVSEGEGSISIFVPVPEFTLPVSVEKGGNGRICFFNSKAISTVTAGCRYNNTQVIGAHSMTPVNRVATNYGTSSTAQCNTLQFYATSSTTELDIDIAPCIVTGDTPTSFIPYGYRIPLDIRHKTKNLVDITGCDETRFGVRWYENNGQLEGSGTYTDSAAHSQPRFYAELSAGTYTLSGSPDYAQTGVQLLVGTCTDAQGSNFTTLGYDTGSGYTFTLQTGSWVSVRVYTASRLYQQTVDLTLPIMLRLADTSSDFEPYYLTNHADIYIGSSPLTQGQTITKSQSNTDLTLFQGNNIVDSTLLNKPNMSLTYNSSVLGVGENTEITGDLPIDFRSNGDDLLGYRIYGTADGAGVQTEQHGYKLPLTITSGADSKDTDIYIGDSKLGEAEYVDYGEQKIYRRILFMTHDDKHFITKDNKDFCLFKEERI